MFGQARVLHGGTPILDASGTSTKGGDRSSKDDRFFAIAIGRAGFLPRRHVQQIALDNAESVAHEFLPAAVYIVALGGMDSGCRRGAVFKVEVLRSFAEIAILQGVFSATRETGRPALQIVRTAVSRFFYRGSADSPLVGCLAGATASSIGRRRIMMHSELEEAPTSSTFVMDRSTVFVLFGNDDLIQSGVWKRVGTFGQQCKSRSKTNHEAKDQGKLGRRREKHHGGHPLFFGMCFF